jgi:small-conductance mechanosensitive channel
VVVPNNKLGQSIYTNYSLPDRRIAQSISFSVGYDSDVDRVQQLLAAEAAAAIGEVKGLAEQPGPSVLFSPGPGDSALVFQVNFTVDAFGEQDAVKSELRRRLFKRLKAEGITMPAPSRTLLVEQKDRG